MRRTGFVALIVALGPLWLWTAAPEAVQESKGEKTPSRVTLPQSVGPPGGSVAVPIQVAAAAGVQIGSLTLALRFDASALTFANVEMGGLGEAVGARATAKIETSAGETRLEVAIAAPEKEGVRPPIPDGPIAHVMFTIAGELKPETVIPLKVQAVAAASASGAESVELAVRDGEIVVSNPSVIGCFFYMH